ncbi:hypothetical protein HK096_002496, partial [Nowakowskiella sp. JEL0078]
MSLHNLYITCGKSLTNPIIVHEDNEGVIIFPEFLKEQKILQGSKIAAQAADRDCAL